MSTDSTNSNDETLAEQLRLRRAKARLKSVKILSATGILGLSLAGIGAWVLMGNQIVISDEAKVYGLSVLVFVFVTSFPTIWAVEKLRDPDIVYVARVNATFNDIVDVYAASPSKWEEEVTMVSGEPVSYSQFGSTVYLVTDFIHVDDVNEDDEIAAHIPDDVGGWVAAGSWLGESGDHDIVTDRTNLTANRRRNALWGRIGKKLYAKFKEVSRDAEHRAHKNMVDKQMDMQLYDADIARDTIEQRVPELNDLAEDKSVPEIVEDEVHEQIEDLNTADIGGGSGE